MKWPWTIRRLGRHEPFGFAALLVAGAVVGGCSSDEPAMLNVDENVTVKEPVAPKPNYASRESDVYLYVSAVSEEDQKAGQSAGDVSMYRYLGERDGSYHLEILRDRGDRVAIAECVRDCKVIKTTWIDGTVSRLGYNPSSVIGSAFEDAFSGNLVPAKGGSTRTESKEGSQTPPTIPAAFLGEWNESAEACKTGLSDTRLRVELRRLRFYESDAQVERVTVKNDRAVTVAASFAGEGETWNDSITMVLSRSGNDLTIEGLTRHRCR